MTLHNATQRGRGALKGSTGVLKGWPLNLALF